MGSFISPLLLGDMMMSIPMQEAYAIAEKFNKSLKSDDSRFSGIVIVHSLNDFSSFTFSDAFAVYYKDFYIIFTEHYGFHLYHEEDASVVMYTKRKGIDELKIEV